MLAKFFKHPITPVLAKVLREWRVVEREKQYVISMASKVLYKTTNSSLLWVHHIVIETRRALDVKTVSSFRKISGLVSKWIMDDSRLENSRYPSEWVSDQGRLAVYDKQWGRAWSLAT